MFLSFTLLTGEGGMISLCQISFAGVGGLTAAQMNATYHLPVLLGVLIGAVLAGACGLVVGLLTARMGNLYAALATLTLALLLSSIVFQLNVFLQYGAGVTVSRPSFAESNVSLTYLTLAVFVAISLFIAAIRRSTSGLALSAIRSTETGARSAGVSVVRLKIGLWTLAAAIAGIGGGMYVIYNGVALPQSFDAIIGLTWFAVVITNGRRSNNAALAAGLFYTLIPQLFTTYLPTSLGQVPTLLFGAGAVLLARNPDGIITMNGRQITALARRLTGSGRRTGGGQPLPAEPGGPGDRGGDGRPGRDGRRRDGRGPGARAGRRRETRGRTVSTVHDERHDILSGTQVPVNFRGSRRCSRLTSRCRKAPSSASSARTERASPPCSGSCRETSSPARATSASPGRTSQGSVPRHEYGTDSPARSSFPSSSTSSPSAST